VLNYPPEVSCNAYAPNLFPHAGCVLEQADEGPIRCSKPSNWLGRGIVYFQFIPAGFHLSRRLRHLVSWDPTASLQLLYKPHLDCYSKSTLIFNRLQLDCCTARSRGYVPNRVFILSLILLLFVDCYTSSCWTVSLLCYY